jgi:hypothetical protein
MGVAPKGASHPKIFEGSINISPLCGEAGSVFRTLETPHQITLGILNHDGEARSPLLASWC